MIQERLISEPDATAEPFAVPAGVDFKALLGILLAGKVRIALTALSVSVVVMWIAFSLPIQFTANASIIPPGTGGSSTAAALMGQLSALGGGGMLGGAVKNPSDVYVSILKSRSIAEAMVRRFGLMKLYGVKRESQAEKVLAQKTLIAVGAKDGMISINVTDYSAERARDLVAGYLDALRATTGGLALTESSQRRQFYENRLLQEKTDLASSEVELKQMQEKSGLIAPAGQTAAEIQAIAQLRAEIAGRQVRLASLRHDETDENPDVMRVRSEIADLQGQVARMEKGSGKGYGGLSTVQVPGLQLDYIRAARDVKYHEALFEIIAKQYEAARLDEAHEPSIQVLDPPIVPDTKSGPPRMIMTIVGFVLGGLAGVVWVLYAAWRRIPRLEAAS